MLELLLNAGVNIINEKIALPEWCKRVKIDIGLSENAPQSESWLKEDDELVVFGFEPVSTSCQTILNGSSKFPVKLSLERIRKSFFLIPIALTDQRGPSKLVFNITQNDPGCSSALEPLSFDVNRTEVVDAYSLSDFLDYFNFEGNVNFISYVKTDCQGYDINVLKGAEEYLGKIACYTCEIETEQYRDSYKNSLVEFQKIFDLNSFQQYKKSRLTKITKLFDKYPFVQCDDPTFINTKFKNGLKKYTNNIIQRG
jgi:FkbM family methyltransferase